MTTLGLAGALFCENEQAYTKWTILCSEKILTWMLREARRVLKTTVGNRVQPDCHFISIVFVLFCFFEPESCVLCQAMLKNKSAHIGHCRPKPG